MVDMTFENSKLIARGKPILAKKLVAPRPQKETNQDKKQEPEAPEAIMSQQLTSQESTTNNELVSMEKPEVKAIVEEEAPAQMDEPNIIELKVNQTSGVKGSDYETPFSLGVIGENGEAVKEQAGQSSDFKCSYYFGYLSQRDKAEVIPETCFGCLKSIECMMSEYHKTKESVEEIKKWYSFKL